MTEPGQDGSPALPSDPSRVKPVIGLSGGVGAGKSSVARLLASLGAAVIDADRVAHEELARPDVVATLKSWWGDRVCREDGLPDRQAIAEIVFANPADLDRLESLLYPGVRRRHDALIASYQADSSVRAVVLDAPKLYEAGLDRRCDAVIFVDADRRVRAGRVARDRGWASSELDRREKLQNPLDRKRANADHIITNNSDLEALREQVERVFASVLSDFARQRGT